MTSNRPPPRTTRGACSRPPGHLVREAAREARPAGSRRRAASAGRSLSPAGAGPSNGSSVTRSPGRPSRSRPAGAPDRSPGPAAEQQADPRPLRRGGPTARPASAGWARIQTLARAWSSAAPERAENDHVRRTATGRGDAGPARCRTQSLSAGERSMATPAGGELGQPRLRRANRRRRRSGRARGRAARRASAPASAAITSVDRRIPARPGAVELGPAGGRCRRPGQGADDHRPILPDDPMLDFRPCPNPVVHPAIQRVLDAASRKGVTLEIRVFDESTHTAAEAAAAVGAELGQIVKSLVFVIGRRGRRARADPVPRVGARTGSTWPGWRRSPGARDVRRATAKRGERAVGLHDRRDPPDRPRPADAGDHGPRPRPLPGGLGGRRHGHRGLPGSAGDAALDLECDRRADRRGPRRPTRPRDRRAARRGRQLPGRDPGPLGLGRQRRRPRRLRPVGGRAASLAEHGALVSPSYERQCRAELRVETPGRPVDRPAGLADLR